MAAYQIGDRVRIDIPDTSDPDHNRYHDREGEIVGILQDDLSGLTHDARDDYIYTVEFDDGERMDFRWSDLRHAEGGGR